MTSAATRATPRLLVRLRSRVIRTLKAVLPDRYWPSFVSFSYPLLSQRRRGSPTRFKRTREGLWLAYSRVQPTHPSVAFYNPHRAERFVHPGGPIGATSWLRNRYEGDRARIVADDIVLDVGANVGEFSLSVITEARLVIAIEADEVAYRCLEKNLSGFSNALAIQSLVSDEPGDVVFYSSPAGADSSLIEPFTTYTQMIRRATTIDDLCRHGGWPTIDVVKCDAEGAEPEVLKGAMDTLRSARVALIDTGNERRGLSTSSEVSEILEGLGFNLDIERGVVKAWRY